MGEIKSTLDIVMEKTKHLSLSDEEKAEKQKEAIQKTTRGLVQKYQDQIMLLKDLIQEWRHLETAHNLTDKTILIEEIMSRITLGSDNSRLLALLQEGCGVETKTLESILKEYTVKKDEITQHRVQELKVEIADRFRISGSAVVPNLKEELDWAEAMRVFEGTYQEKIDQEIGNYI